MLDFVADVRREDVEYELSDNEEEYSEADVAQWPTILQRVDHEEDLHDQVDQDAESVDEVQDDE